MSTKREQILEIYREMASKEPVESRAEDFRTRFIQTIQERVEGLDKAAKGTLGMYYAWSRFKVDNNGVARKYHSEKRVKGKAKEEQEVEDARAAFLEPVKEPVGWKKVESVLYA